jgi:hypothetical protein
MANCSALAVILDFEDRRISLNASHSGSGNHSGKGIGDISISLFTLFIFILLVPFCGAAVGLCWGSSGDSLSHGLWYLS